MASERNGLAVQQRLQDLGLTLRKRVSELLFERRSTDFPVRVAMVARWRF